MLVKVDEGLREVVDGDLARLHRLIEVLARCRSPKELLRHLIELARHRGLDASPILKLWLALGKGLRELLQCGFLHLSRSAAGKKRIVECQHDVGRFADVLHRGHDLLHTRRHGIKARRQSSEVIAHLLDRRAGIRCLVAQAAKDAGESRHRVNAGNRRTDGVADRAHRCGDARLHGAGNGAGNSRHLRSERPERGRCGLQAAHATVEAAAELRAAGGAVRSEHACCPAGEAVHRRHD